MRLDRDVLFTYSCRCNACLRHHDVLIINFICVGSHVTYTRLLIFICIFGSLSPLVARRRVVVHCLGSESYEILVLALSVGVAPDMSVER